MARIISVLFIGILLCTISITSSGQDVNLPTGEQLVADTPTTTVHGNNFIAPAGWNLSVRGPATFLQAPEGDSWIVLVDVHAENGDEALAAGWAAYKKIERPLFMANDEPDKDGWSKKWQFVYETSANEQRDVSAGVLFAGGVWTVWIYDMAHAVAGKRGAQISLVFSSLLPKGYTRESFAGRKANKLNESRVAALTKFIKDGRKATGLPGVSVGIIQDGKVVFAGGFGVRKLGGKAEVDADTLYLIASNTKALTTLLIAKLVDDGQLTWKTAVQSVLPNFKLGDPETARRVLVEHLVCACTGLPRQDLEWLFQFEDLTPEGALATLATMQPTSEFGKMFQYSNPLAAAGGFVAGHVMFPDLKLGTAYDKAIQAEVFDPLGMNATTFDYERALADNHASAHSFDIDGNPAYAVFELNYSIVPVRPAGAAWSNVNDLLKYVAMELAEGALPNGKRYITKGPLLERRVPKVSRSKTASYGMGLVVEERYGVKVVHHGGDMIGYYSDMMWLPEHDVGAVILTNGDLGWLIRSGFRRKLLEVLFNGRREADAMLASESDQFFDRKAAARKLLVVPAAKQESGNLASYYINDALGEITVNHTENKALIFNFGEWKSEMASRRSPDGTVSFVTIAPGVSGGFEFVVGSGTKRSLILRDQQHEYVFYEQQ